MKPMRTTSLWLVVLFLFLLLLLTVGSLAAKDQSHRQLATIIEQSRSFFDRPRHIDWRALPQVKTIQITSTADGSRQPALYYDSGSDWEKPLLVALHSWSGNYHQKSSIPYAAWAVDKDWVFIHPDYRGAFVNPKATGSEFAVQDIVDAVDYARRNARIDNNRVYLIGFSGGGMVSLLMAGRHPELWTAVAAWVPIYDLNEWYRHVFKVCNHHYVSQIAKSCGAPPLRGSPEERECEKRSPSKYLDNARGKPLRIYIAHGVQDDVVPPSDAIKAYNSLANPEDRIAESDIAAVDTSGSIPKHLAGPYEDALYSDARKPLLFRRTSGNVTLNLFRGGHDVLFKPGLQWLSEQKRD